MSVGHHVRSGLRVASFALLTLGLFWPAAAGSQELKTSWDTHDELMQWMAYRTSPEPSEPSAIERRTEDGRDYLRIRLGPTYSPPYIGRPGGDWEKLGIRLDKIAALPVAMDPRNHNALKITLRHQAAGFHRIVGTWAHRSAEEECEEGPQSTCAIFDPRESPDTGEWHDVVLKFTDSPFFDLDEPVVIISVFLGPGGVRTLEGLAAAGKGLTESSYLDVDRIEFIKMEENIPHVVVTDITPRRGRYGCQATITGSGFAVPAERNVVILWSGKVKILSGDATHLVVEMNGSGSESVTVYAPGGGKAASPQPFVFYGRPRDFQIVAGDRQTGKIGARLSPLAVKVADRSGEGVPDEPVEFRVSEGNATLSVAKVTSNAEGVASTVVTLGSAPGRVRITAVCSGFRPEVFTLTAEP